MKVCEYDTGSLFDNRRVCEEVASHAAVYRNGSYGPFTVNVCGNHLGSVEGRAFPGTQSVVCLTA